MELRKLRHLKAGIGNDLDEMEFMCRVVVLQDMCEYGVCRRSNTAMKLLRPIKGGEFTY